MPVVSKTILKGYFENGKEPNENDYIDLIDTMNDDADKLDGSHGDDYAKLADNEVITGAYDFNKEIDMLDVSSAPATPPSAYGRLYVLGRTLTFKRDNGETMNISAPGQIFGVASGLPYGPYMFTQRKFENNNFPAHLAEFQDSQTSPYSFGGSPGGFSITCPSGGIVSSNNCRHWLEITGSGHSSPVYLQWTDATGKNYFDWIGMQFGTFAPGSATYMFEVRFWGVQSPGASDNYYSMRFKMDTGGYFISAWRGTGVTYSISDGTQLTNWTPLPLGMPYRLRGHITTGPAFTPSGWATEGYVGLYQYCGSLTGYPTICKTARWIFPVGVPGYSYFVDRVSIY